MRVSVETLKFGIGTHELMGIKIRKLVNIGSNLLIMSITFFIFLPLFPLTIISVYEERYCKVVTNAVEILKKTYNRITK